MKKARVERHGQVVMADCEITESAWERMKGLLPKSNLAEGEALWIAPCTSVHTFFMRFTMDAAFLDKEGRVIAIYHAMRPWRLSGIHFRAAGVLETAAGSLARVNLQKGEVLKICPIA